MIEDDCDALQTKIKNEADMIMANVSDHDDDDDKMKNKKRKRKRTKN